MNAQDIPEEAGESKANRDPFLKFYVDDWIAGTASLSYEEKGIYVDLLCMMWARKGGMPNDVDALARHLRSDRRKVRRLIEALVAAGKLAIVDDQIVNPRLARDIKRRPQTTKRQPKVGPKSGRSRAEVGEKSGRSRGEVGPKSARTFMPTAVRSMAYRPVALAPMEDHPEARYQKPEEEVATQREDGSWVREGGGPLASASGDDAAPGQPAAAGDAPCIVAFPERRRDAA